MASMLALVDVHVVERRRAGSGIRVGEVSMQPLLLPMGAEVIWAPGLGALVARMMIELRSAGGGHVLRPHGRLLAFGIRAIAGIGLDRLLGLAVIALLNALF